MCRGLYGADEKDGSLRPAILSATAAENRILGIEARGEYIHSLMLAERIRHIEQRIQDACRRSGRAREEITLVAVTKMHPFDAINEAIAAGLQDIGENRVQEYLAKQPHLQPHRFHMIGHLQRNKVRHILPHAAMIHSVDSMALADEIQRRSPDGNARHDVLIEINSSAEDSKFGVTAEELPFLAEHIMSLPALRLRGLMTVAAFVDEAETLRPVFRRMRLLRDGLAQRYQNEAVRELSMGMTNDFEVAIEEGATLIRIGSAIFGPRA
jgi:PLP dependent protein